MPQNVVTINNDAFKKSKINSIDLSGVTTIGSYCFEQCSALTSATLTNVTTLGDGAFKESGLTGNITLPNVSNISYGVFQGTNLTSVDFTGSTFTKADDQTFMFVSTLDHVIFPSTVTQVGKMVFYNCSNLSYLVFPTTSTITWQNNSLSNVPSSCIMYVADSKVSEVTTAVSGQFNG